MNVLKATDVNLAKLKTQEKHKHQLDSNFTTFCSEKLSS